MKTHTDHTVLLAPDAFKGLNDPVREIMCDRYTADARRLHWKKREGDDV